MKRRYPAEFFNISFLDVVTSTSGVFLLFVLVSLAAIFLSARTHDEQAQEEERIRWTTGLVLRGELESELAMRQTLVSDIDSVETCLSEMRNRGRIATIAKSNAIQVREMERQLSRQGELSTRIDSLTSARVDLEARTIRLAARAPQASKLRHLRPAVLPTEDPNHWTLICLAIHDSVYVTNGQHRDDAQFVWDDSLMICWPRHGAGEPIGSAVQNDSKFMRRIRKESDEGDVIDVHLWSGSEEFYPSLRDALVGSKRRLALILETGIPEIGFSSTGWSPAPIY